MDIKLDNILQESKLRYENLRAGIALGLFGPTVEARTNNLIRYNTTQKEIVDKACKEIETIFKG